MRPDPAVGDTVGFGLRQSSAVQDCITPKGCRSVSRPELDIEKNLAEHLDDHEPTSGNT
jgi:hypothetical protein